jgi:transposase InsO family protein
VIVGIADERQRRLLQGPFYQRLCRARHLDLRTKAYTPQTNGKAKRLIQTLLREWAYLKEYPKSRRRTAALLPYLRYYNRRRPRAGCGALTPMKKLERAA